MICKCGHDGEIHMNLRTNKTNVGRCLIDSGIDNRCNCMKFKPITKIIKCEDSLK